MVYSRHVFDLKKYILIGLCIDAVFMNDLENEFGAESDDFNDDDMDADGYTQSEKP